LFLPYLEFPVFLLNQLVQWDLMVQHFLLFLVCLVFLGDLLHQSKQHLSLRFPEVPWGLSVQKDPPNQQFLEFPESLGFLAIQLVQLGQRNQCPLPFLVFLGFPEFPVNQ
jgi:hypothetical protein